MERATIQELEAIGGFAQRTKATAEQFADKLDPKRKGGTSEIVRALDRVMMACSHLEHLAETVKAVKQSLK